MRQESRSKPLLADGFLIFGLIATFAGIALLVVVVSVVAAAGGPVYSLLVGIPLLLGVALTPMGVIATLWALVAGSDRPSVEEAGGKAAQEAYHLV